MNIKEFISKIRVKDISDIDFSNTGTDSIYIFADAYKTIYRRKSVLAYRLYLYLKDQDIFFPVISGIVQKDKYVSEYVKWENDGTTTMAITKKNITNLLEFVQWDIRAHYHKPSSVKYVYTDIVDVPEKETGRCVNGSEIIGIIADTQREVRKEKVLRFNEKCRSYMKDMPKLSDSFDQWLRYSFMPNSRYFFYTYQNKKMIQGTCSVCGSVVKLPKGINGSKGICPVCKREITYRSARRRSTAYAYDYSIYVQRAHGTIYLRMFEIIKSFGNLHQSVYLRECYRIVIQKGNAYCFRPTLSVDDSGIVWRIATDSAVQKAIHWLTLSYDCSIYMPLGVQVFNGFYVEEHLKEIYAKTKGQERISAALKRLILIVSDWRVESLIKIGCESSIAHLSSDFMHNLTIFKRKKYKKLHQSLGIKKQYLQVLRNSATNKCTLRQLQELSEIPQTIAVNTLTEMLEREIPIPVMYAISKIGMDTYESYLDFQMRGQENQDRNYWNSLLKAYLGRIGQISRFTEKEQEALLFPSDLRIAYERVRLYKVPKLNDEQMRKLFRESQERYGYSNDKFAVVAPKTIDDVDHEGIVLDHCIVRYLTKVEKGSTSILFIRKNQEPTVPFYTMECRGKEVLQCRGFNNKAPTAEVAEFLQEYKKYLTTGGNVS